MKRNAIRRMVCLGLAVGMLSLAAPSSASAGVVFSNFGLGLAYDFTAGNPVGNAFDGNNYAEGSTFTPTSTSTLLSLVIALSCPFNCPAPDAVTVSLTGDAGDQPGVVLESFAIPGIALGPFGVHNPPRVLNSVFRPLLVVGTRYWVTVSADLNDSISWDLNSTGDVSDTAISGDGGATWFSPSGNTPGAFEVDSTVPEPASAAVVAGGGLLLHLLRRRRT